MTDGQQTPEDAERMMREMKEESDRAKQEIVDRYNKYFPLGIPSGGEPTA